MSETKFTQGPWTAYNMVNSETGAPMTPGEISEYVGNCVRARPECSDFLFISAEKDGVPADVCHVGNGSDGPYNAHLIAAAPELYEALAAFERVVDLWLPADSEVDVEHYGEAEALAGLRRTMVDALAKARGEQ